MRLTKVIWLFPWAFILHDLEEVITMAGWIERHPDLIARLPIAPAVATTAQVAGAVGFEWFLTIVAAYLGAREAERGRLHWFFASLSGALFLNVFTHVGQGLLSGGYTPGILTAPTIILPYSVYLYHCMAQAGLMDRRRLVLALVSAVPVGLAGVLTAHQIGRLLF